jgi:drug/metabolite transporter (DMT)-like permease
VAVSGVLYMTYPLFTLLIGWLLFRGPLSPSALLGAALILGAAGLATQTDGASGQITLAAVLLALAAPLGFGFSINVLARKLWALRPLSRMAIFALGSATGLVPLILTYPAEQVIPAEPSLWLLALALGTVSALLPQLIYTTFVPKIGSARAAALGAIELPTMFAVGWIAFGETVGFREGAAGIMVLAAILLTPAEPARDRKDMP